MKQLVLLALVCLFAGCSVKETSGDRPDRNNSDKDYVAMDTQSDMVKKKKMKKDPQQAQKKKTSDSDQ